MSHLGDFDSRGRSGEAGLAGFEVADGAKVSLTEAVQTRHPEPVRVTRDQILLVPALIVLRSRQLPLSLYLFTAAGSDRILLVLCRQEVLGDLTVKTFKHAHIKPNRVILVLLRLKTETTKLIKINKNRNFKRVWD